ncbi:MAG: DMT family transporter [Nitrososphaerales archaeon]|jgi:drug/metabolite transporter (DMT)-like permease
MTNPTALSTRVVTQARAYSLLIVLSIIWGLAFDAISEADKLLSPINLTLLRWFIAAAGYLVILPFLGKAKIKFEWKDLPRLLVIAFANVPLYHLSLNYGETSVSAGVAGLLVALGPVFIVLLSRVSLKEEIERKLAIALVIATLGAILLSVSDLGGPSGSMIGIAEVIVTAFAYALFAVLSKPLVAKYGSLPVAIRAGTIGTAMLLPLVSESFISQVSKLSPTGWLSVLYLSILSTVVGYSMFYILLNRGTVSRLSIQLYLIPIISVIGGALLLGQRITIFTVAGGAILLLAVSLATRSQAKNRNVSEAPKPSV